MESNITAKDGTPMLYAEYWTIGKWFGFLVLVLVLWTGLYLIGHSDYGIPEPAFEYTSFNTSQIRQINRILTNNELPEAVPNSIAKTDAPVSLIDSSVTMSIPVTELHNLNTGNGCDMPCRIDKVLLYVNSEFDNKVSPQQLLTIRQYLSTFNQQEAGIFLADYKIKVRSYFWLSGPLIYLETIFWVVAGVICSLLFSVASLLGSKKSKAFDSKKIMSQVAKLFYAPFMAIVIMLAYNYMRDNATLSRNMGQGIIIFAFVLGIFSGKIMSFFDKFKNLLLPSEEAEQIVYAPQPAPSAEPVYNVPPTADTIKQEYTNTNSTAENFVVDEQEEFNTATKQKREDGELIDVEIEVKLDNSGLFDDERNDITKTGFNKAIITLHNVNGRDIIAAKKVADKEATFLAVNVKPGIYIARATLSMRFQNDQIINLFGERTSYITVDKPGLELYIRKYELVD